MKEKVMRKKDPTARRNIHVVTLKNVEIFLKEQLEPVYKSEIVRAIGVNYDSLNIALEMLPIKINEEGKISLEGKR